jgi:alkylated DNA repair dioxygenase AlkB
MLSPDFEGTVKLGNTSSSVERLLVSPPEGITYEEFEELWSMKPQDRLVLTFGGKEVRCPRYAMTYMRDYNFNHSKVNFSNTLPPIIDRIFQAAKQREPRLNQALVNWYEDDGYIGFHSDSTTQLIPLAPIFSYSFMPDGIGPSDLKEFRLKNKSNNEIDVAFSLSHNSLLIMHNTCQQTHMHSALKYVSGKDGRRINVTFRCFKE